MKNQEWAHEQIKGDGRTPWRDQATRSHEGTRDTETKTKMKWIKENNRQHPANVN